MHVARQTSLSFVVVDPTSDSIVGGDFLFNYLDGVECVEHHHCMQPIVDLLRAVETPVRDRLEVSADHGGFRDRLESSGNQGGLMYNFCLFVDSRLAAAEHVSICHFIESSVLRVARHGEYTAVLTNNTNPVTQVTDSYTGNTVTQVTQLHR